MTAYAEVYGRHASALAQAYGTLNLSPFGAAALGTSSYPTNRERVAELLGFDRPIHNSYDAVLLSPIEVNMRLAGTMAGIGATTNQLIQDLGNQYYLAKPWLTVPLNLAGGSTIMPQKVNPNSINTTRNDLALLFGEVTTYLFEIHNVESGYFGGGGGGGAGYSADKSIELTTKVLTNVASMFDSFIFHEERAREVLLDDYATATELANALQRIGNIPFREAHHVTAAVVQFGREKGLRASEIQYDDFLDVFQEAAAEHHMPNKTPGITQEQFKAVMLPENLVKNAVGLGGPQPSSVASMLAENRKVVEQNKSWAAETRKKLDEASANLDEAFEKVQGK